MSPSNPSKQRRGFPPCVIPIVRNPRSLKSPAECVGVTMGDEGRDSSLRREDRKHGGDSWSANVGSGGSSAGGFSRRRKFSAPRCSSGAFAILFESSTPSNPNRLFFDCQHFKTKGSHCRYFAWLDEFVASVHAGEGGVGVDVADPITKIEGRMASLEKMMMLISDCNKGRKEISLNKFGGILFFLLGIAFAISWGALFS
ncbi:hypothetical protein PIB30_079879 [Stylosanthes scabra]|uniref:GRF-type domain-containing protein n=1 Tax=Stylosanthes scabra TaxID=79078 RepID=A0ABU6STG0_9FABA|nr:hypothetical protein [Stylosanthes scabra]